MFELNKSLKMKKTNNLSRHMKLLTTLAVIICTVQSCREAPKEATDTTTQTDTPEYFLLRPGVEKAYGYSHAVKIGEDLKISGAVSMDSAGNLTAAGNMDQQMKNCYNDLDMILKHYGYTFDDVVVENVYTTNMSEFIKCSAYRNSIYKKQFPTGTWLEVKGLALQGQLIEIDMEGIRQNKSQ
jgi:2-iminobutanoate/2-iminopropanoate deaminase